MKKMLFLVVMLLSLFFITSCGGSNSNKKEPSVNDLQLNFELSEDELSYVVSGKHNSKGEIIIPDTYLGLPVKSIKNEAFRDCVNLISITIPNSVTSIGDMAFSNCSALTNVEISNNVTKIGGYAFSKCTSLLRITIPDSVTEIGSYAFSNCSSLESIIIPSGIKSIGSEAFSGCSSLKFNMYNEGLYLGNFENKYVVLVEINDKTITSYEVCGGTKIIFGKAFSECSLLESVLIPDSVVSISSKAFLGCGSLKYNVHNEGLYLGNYANKYLALMGINEKKVKSFEIHENAKLIDETAFFDCDLLENVIIPRSIKNIGIGAFSECSLLENVYYTGTINEWCNISLEGYGSNPMTFASHFYMLDEKNEYYEVTEIVIPNTIKVIGVHQFYGFDNVKFIIIPDSVTSIGYEAFAGCYNLSRITLGNEITNIDEKAFSGCNKLVEVYNLSNINIIAGKKAYGYVGYFVKAIHSSLDEESILSEVNDFIFMNINNEYSLISYYGNETDVILPEDINGSSYKIYDYAFSSSNLTSIIIPSGVKSIGYSAFSGCSSLKNIEIKEGLTSIADYAFYKCSSLTNIEIPNGVTNVGDYTFSGCSNLTSITIPASITSINKDPFGSCYRLYRINYGGTVEDWCNITFEEHYSNPMYYTSNFYMLDENNEWYEVNEIIIPNTIEKIGDYQFSGFGHVDSITIPDSVTSIGRYAFYNCGHLTEISIPSSVTSVGNRAFYECYSLNYHVYNGGLYLGNSENEYMVFIEVSDNTITPYILHEDTKVLADSVFLTHSSLESIIVPDSVTYVGNWVFAHLGSLTDIYYTGTQEQWNNINFGLDNYNLTTSTIHFYSEEEPTTDGNYWHYDVNGNVVLW